ncbi:MAG: nucleotidyltransferase family protein [Leptolyngbyaceae cyanobacterium SM1_3_5]|nr:nucleotidyltransferase family protein [Leptolyngbyaceae cyanobacterium SM1_3_5]
MMRNEVLSILTNHWLVLKELGLQSLAVFGSVARDQARPDSDVDILVEFQLPVTFDRYMDVKFYLEDQLGVPVDLVTRRSLKSDLREAIEAEAVRVA